jgi:hypothetical protein
MASVDFFTVPTVAFQLLFVVVVLSSALVPELRSSDVATKLLSIRDLVFSRHGLRPAAVPAAWRFRRANSFEPVVTC